MTVNQYFVAQHKKGWAEMERVIKTVHEVVPDYVARNGPLVLEVNSESDYGGPENPREDADFGHMLCWHKRMNFGSEPQDFNISDRGKLDAHFARILADEFKLSDEQREYVEYYCPINRMINALREHRKFVALPIYIFEHSGVTISTERGYFDAIDPGSWDHGQLGIIYATESEIKKWLGKTDNLTDEDLKKAHDGLKDIIKTYDMYLSGEVYVYSLYDSESEENIDSCGGIYAEDIGELKEGIKATLPEEYRYLADKLEVQS